MKHTFRAKLEFCDENLITFLWQCTVCIVEKTTACVQNIPLGLTENYTNK